MHRALAGVVGRDSAACVGVLRRTLQPGGLVRLWQERGAWPQPRHKCKLPPVAANSGIASVLRCQQPAAQQNLAITDSLAKPEQEVDQHCRRRSAEQYTHQR